MGIPDGFRHLRAYLSGARQADILAAVRAVIAEAPLYVPVMPRSGKPLSVRMTNCGSLGWVTDRELGYRYQPLHPLTGRAWPPIPPELCELWSAVAGCPAPPEACLVNFYAPTAKLGSHRDEDEEEFAAPVVSVSLGDDAVFHVGGLRRSDPKTRMLLRSGDVVVLGGSSRLAYHGVDRVLSASYDLLPQGGRLNLTLRRVTKLTSGTSVSRPADDQGVSREGA